MPTVGDRVLDNGLSALKAEATDLNVNTAEPGTFLAATTGGLFLGKKVAGAGAVYPGAIAAGSPNGRKLTTLNITDGAITAGGTAAAYSVTDNSNSRLLVTGAISPTQVVTSGNPFSMSPMDHRLPGA
jgi:hypothetical protein